MKFDFNDILLTPARRSVVSSRKQINPFDKNGYLPIMTAPMDTVIDENNIDVFNENKIYGILPRHANSNTVSCNKFQWYSYGLSEFKEIFLTTKLTVEGNENAKFYALIDVANGHMNDLYQTAKLAKEMYNEKLVLMIGNIANPNTLLDYINIGVDYVRVGIGGGAGCLTSVQTGVGYPMGSLINECFLIKRKAYSDIKIVADGGFKSFADINKALALGADYVMLGSMLNKCYESTGPLMKAVSIPSYGVNSDTYEEFDIDRYLRNFDHIKSHSLEQQKKMILFHNTLYKKYRGMSTKEVQKSWGKSNLKTSEGISKFNKVEYTLQGFIENLEDYLRSAMSYTGSLNLTNFKLTEFTEITSSSFNRFNK